jgi:hypothetical protein
MVNFLEFFRYLHNPYDRVTYIGGYYESHQDTAAHAIVYPFGDAQMKWLTDDNIPKSASNSCDIPFYHITGAAQSRWPDGYRHQLDEREETHHDGHGAQEHLNDDVSIITSAVIVTLKSLSLLLQHWLPSDMKSLTSIIADYLSSIGQWEVEVCFA